MWSSQYTLYFDRQFKERAGAKMRSFGLEERLQEAVWLWWLYEHGFAHSDCVNCALE